MASSQISLENIFSSHLAVSSMAYPTKKEPLNEAILIGNLEVNLNGLGAIVCVFLPIGEFGTYFDTNLCVFNDHTNLFHQ